MSKHSSKVLVGDQPETVVAVPGETAAQPSTPVEMGEPVPVNEQDVSDSGVSKMVGKGMPARVSGGRLVRGRTRTAVEKPAVHRRAESPPRPSLRGEYPCEVISVGNGFSSPS